MSKSSETYSIEFIRAHSGFSIPKSNGIKEPKLNKTEAAQLCIHIANALGLDRELFYLLLAKQCIKEFYIDTEAPPVPSLESEGHVVHEKTKQ